MSVSELAFFNNLSGKLEIELTKPPEQVANLLNLQADPDARVISMKLHAEFWNPDTQQFRELTSEELDSVAFPFPRIDLRGESGDIVSHEAPNGRHFTVRELLQAVEETERQTRDDSEWLGGVDVHHCFFEGLEPDDEDDDVWMICWGS